MYTFSELIWNIRKVGKIDSRKIQGQSAFNDEKLKTKSLMFLVSFFSCDLQDYKF